MVQNCNLSKIYNFENSRDIFPDVNIGGGVQYFLWTRKGNENSISQNKEHISKYKVITGKVNPGTGNLGGIQVINKPRILYPGEICSLSYLVIGSFDTEQEALNCMKFYKTKVVRFLIMLTQFGMNMTFKNYIFVPKLDFNLEYTDKDLAEMFELATEELEYIDSKIKEMV